MHTHENQSKIEQILHLCNFQYNLYAQKQWLLNIHPTCTHQFVSRVMDYLGLLLELQGTPIFYNQ